MTRLTLPAADTRRRSATTCNPDPSGAIACVAISTAPPPGRAKMIVSDDRPSCNSESQATRIRARSSAVARSSTFAPSNSCRVLPSSWHAAALASTHSRASFTTANGTGTRSNTASYATCLAPSCDERKRDRDRNHVSSSASIAKTDVRRPGRWRTGRPKLISHRCTVRTERPRYSAMSFHEFRVDNRDIRRRGVSFRKLVQQFRSTAPIRGSIGDRRHNASLSHTMFQVPKSYPGIREHNCQL
jgi:hypothetical protein